MSRLIAPFVPFAPLAAFVALAAALAMSDMARASQPDAVYRCGPGDYRAQPCPGGQEVDVPPPPTAAERAAAEATARREARLGRELERERLRLEKSAARQGPMALTIPREPTAAGAAPGSAKDGRPGKSRGHDKSSTKGGSKGSKAHPDKQAPSATPAKPATSGRLGAHGARD